jgi:autotransporter-associated beta strand protein
LALGSAIFLQGNETITLAPAVNTVETIFGVIADQTGSGGTGANAGAGHLLIAGAGTVDLHPTVANTFTGGVTIKSGILELAVPGAAGSGGISFASTSGEVKVAAGAHLANTITAFGGSGDRIDFSTVAWEPGDHATVDSNGKVVIETSANVPVATFQVSGTYTSANFKVSADASGRDVLVTYVAAPASAALAESRSGSPVDLLGQHGSAYNAPPSTPRDDGLWFDVWNALVFNAGADPAGFEFRHARIAGEPTLPGSTLDHGAVHHVPIDHWDWLLR